MAARLDRAHTRPLHPLHAMLLAFPLALFIGALLSDWAYFTSHHIQWLNFAAWLNAGGMLVGTFALIWALADLIRGRDGLFYFIALLATWVLGFINALVHGKDAWATMPAGLYLSIIVALLALVAAWLGYSRVHSGDVK